MTQLTPPAILIHLGDDQAVPVENNTVYNHALWKIYYIRAAYLSLRRSGVLPGP
jgi:hypothetical protein